MPSLADNQTEFNAIVATFGEQGLAAGVAQRIEWSSRALGPVQQWPPLLRSLLRLAMDSPHPTVVVWGADALVFFNDAAIPEGAAELEVALGRPAATHWPEFAVEEGHARAFAGERVHERGRRVTLWRNSKAEHAWFDLEYVPIREADGQVAGVLHVRRERTDEVLARRHYEFSAGLADALRPLIDPLAIQATATRLLGTHLGASCVMYGVVENDDEHIRFDRSYVLPGTPEILGRFRMRDFGEQFVSTLRAGKNLAIERLTCDGDLAAHEREAYAKAGIASLACVPLVKHGQFVGSISVLHVSPHRWTPQEIASIEETAERTWSAVERACAEAVLRDSETRTTYLLALSDSLRTLSDPIAIQSAATRILAEHFAVARSYYSEYDEQHVYVRCESARADAPSIKGVYKLFDFPEQIETLRAGSPFVVHDWQELPAAECHLTPLLTPRVGAQITVPLVKNGKLLAALSIDDSEPRRWSDRDLELVLETAERTWAAVERARVEAALRESEERYRSLFEAMDEGYVYYELFRDDQGRPTDLRLLELNPAFEKMSGMSRERCIGRLRSEVFSEPLAETVAEMLAVYLHAMETDQPNRVELYAPGLCRWFDVRIHPRSGARLALLFDDVTARKRAEQAARDNDACNAYLLTLSDRVRALDDAVSIQQVVTELLAEHLDVARCHYVEYDEERGLALIRSETLRCDAPSELGTYKLADFADSLVRMRRGTPVVADDFEEIAYEEDALALLRKRRVRSYIGVPLVKDGKLVASLTVNDTRPRHWTEADVRLVTDTAERTWAAIQRARAEAALRESEQLARALLDAASLARAEAEAANRAKDEFLATVGHELRTPLAAILIWSRALCSGAIALQDVSHAVDAIARSAESQARLIDDLLDLSRLSSGRFALFRSEVDLQTLVEQAVETVKPLASAKAIELCVETQGDAGAAMLDGTRVNQVLWNLLTNAVKFTPEGGTVKVLARKLEARLEFEVVDTGQGIEPRFLPHVFEKFRQADMGDARQHMGLGIGLALAKQLVELHGGTIRAESAGLGLGATFHFQLPWIAPSAASPKGSASAHSRPIEVSPLCGLRVFLLEDDANTRDGMQWTLERAGATVRAFGDAGAALAALDGDAELDVLVSDLGLPGMSGLEFIRRIGARCEDRGREPPPACAVSAHARDVDRKGAIAAGFDLFLTKPITPERLVEAAGDLRAILTSSRHSER
ncbi:MAG TPA: GAF domain-containing protein [Polyangiaceae bacterium]|nr:GAF domain-containing protein [Polyangiaceae bacterium]